MKVMSKSEISSSVRSVRKHCTVSQDAPSFRTAGCSCLKSETKGMSFVTVPRHKVGRLGGRQAEGRNACSNDRSKETPCVMHRPKALTQRQIERPTGVHRRKLSHRDNLHNVHQLRKTVLPHNTPIKEKVLRPAKSITSGAR